MDLRQIDFEEATGVFKTHFEGDATPFYRSDIPVGGLVGDMLWDELAEAEFLLGYEGDDPLALAIYTADVFEDDQSGVASVHIGGILTDPDDEQRASNFVKLLFQLRTRFQQDKGEYFTTETAPYDDFTVEMLEATEFKLIAPFALMRVTVEKGDTDFGIKPADSIDIILDVGKTLPGSDPYLGDIPVTIASATFEREIANGNTYEVIRSDERLGYVCVVPNPGATAVFGEPIGKLLYAHPWDTFELYEAAAKIEKYNGITAYAPLTEPHLVSSLENTGYRTVGSKLSFRLNLL
ncbi:MAG: hypothetical protein GY771_14450 [bacterium]|nr:hypothetical protein [bacterium]